MSDYIIATTKSWNVENIKTVADLFPDDRFHVITDKDDLTIDILNEINPEFVFFPHWSWIIPEAIYKNYDCVVFHMTDLPFGRGGSPLQNLIVRGIYSTKISAIKVERGLDTGLVYLKEPIEIKDGNASEILNNVSKIIFEKMIPFILREKPVPVPQSGEVTLFERRTPEQSELPDGLSQRQIYDYIRMLDGEGYPPAYKDVDRKRIYFRNAELSDGKVTASVEIVER